MCFNLFWQASECKYVGRSPSPWERSRYEMCVIISTLPESSRGVKDPDQFWSEMSLLQGPPCWSQNGYAIKFYSAPLLAPGPSFRGWFYVICSPLSGPQSNYNSCLPDDLPHSSSPYLSESCGSRPPAPSALWPGIPQHRHIFIYYWRRFRVWVPVREPPDIRRSTDSHNAVA